MNTLPHQEMRAETNLLRQGFRAWLPFIMRSRRHARRFDVVHAPIFPGYLFVDLGAAGQCWQRINGTFGVRKLLTRGEAPQVLPAGFIDGLRSSLGEEGTGDAAWPFDIDTGTRVRVVAGPFADCIATVTGLSPGERITLLLSLLGGEVAVTMARGAVVPAA